MPYTIPYAPRSLYQHSSTLGELARARGEVQARAAERRGEISGQLWSNLGQQLGGLATQWADYKLDQPKREAEAAALATKQREARDVQQAKDIQRLALKPNEQGVLTWDRDLLAREFTTAGLADRLPPLLKSLDDADSAAANLQTAHRKYAREGLGSLLDACEVVGCTPESISRAAEYGVANKFFPRNEAQAIVAKAQAQPEAIPQIVAGLRRVASGQAETPTAPRPVEVRYRNPDGTETIELVAPTPGQRFTSAAPVVEPPKPSAPPAIGSFEDYVTRRFGSQPTPTQITQARRDYQQADDRPLTSAAPSAADAQRTRLVDAVIANPALWDDLTPSIKGDIAADLNAKGFSGFGRRLSDGAITQISETKSAVESLRDLRATLQENESYIGPIAGLAAMNPYSDARQAQAKIDLVRQRVGKALEGGVLRKEDEEKYKKILSTLRDVPNTAIFKVDNLIATLERDLENFIETQRSAGRRVAEPPPRTPQESDAAPPTVGSTVTYQGKRYKVKAIVNGQAELVAVP